MLVDGVLSSPYTLHEELDDNVGEFVTVRRGVSKLQVNYISMTFLFLDPRLTIYILLF